MQRSSPRLLAKVAKDGTVEDLKGVGLGCRVSQLYHRLYLAALAWPTTSLRAVVLAYLASERVFQDLTQGQDPAKVHHKVDRWAKAQAVETSLPRAASGLALTSAPTSDN